MQQTRTTKGTPPWFSKIQHDDPTLETQIREAIAKYGLGPVLAAVIRNMPNKYAGKTKPIDLDNIEI